VKTVLQSGCAQRTSVSMGRLTATQRLKWFAPTRIENKAQCEAKAYYISCLSSSPSCARAAPRSSRSSRPQPSVRFRRFVLWSTAHVRVLPFSDLRGPPIPISNIFLKVAAAAEVHRAACSPQGTRGYTGAESGNPAFRRPSISRFAFGGPPRAIHAEIVKAGSVSSRRAAASRASASRPRCAKADARPR